MFNLIKSFIYSVYLYVYDLCTAVFILFPLYHQESHKTNKKYHTVRTVPKFNRKIVERQIIYL